MWIAIDSAVQGQSHVKTNTPCQDKTYFCNTSEVFVAALADGAGSCKFSHIGAETATQTICELISSEFDSFFYNDNGIEVKKQLITFVVDKLLKKANKENYEINDLSSTLLFVGVKGTNFILGHIGDGVLGYLKNDDLKIASCPNNGEFVNTTVFTTSSTAINNIKLIKGNVCSIDCFILMSDGPEAVFFNKQKKCLAKSLKKIIYLSSLLPNAVSKKLLQNTLEFTVKKHTSDDCSMLIFLNDEKFRGFNELSFADKCYVLNLNQFSPKRINRRFFKIIDILSNKESDVKEIALQVYLKEKYLIKYLQRLMNYGFISKNNDKYICNIKYR